MASTTKGSDNGNEPSSNARVKITVEKLKGKAKADVRVPANPPRNFIRLSTFALTTIGAVAAPPLTISGLPETFPVWATVTVVIGQLSVLLSIAVIATIWTNRL
jgi:hypothetical protein